MGRAPSGGAGPASLFIVGAPRSGTSVLYRSLALHPEAAWISNYVRRAPFLPELGVLNRIATRAPRTRSRVWFGEAGDNAYRYSGARSVLERVFPQPVEGEPVFAHRNIPEADTASAPDPGQLRLRRDLARLRRATGARVLVSKRIGHNRRIGLLAAIEPGSRFVVVTRDGRAVAQSLRRVDWWYDGPVWWYGKTPRDWEAEGRDPLELCARHWVKEIEAIDAGLAGLPDDRVLRIRYEDLVREPHEVLSAVADFAGLGASSQWEAALADLSFPDKNRVSRSDTREEAQIVALQGPALHALGYL